MSQATQEHMGRRVMAHLEGKTVKTAEPGNWYVRIRPYDPRRGHFLRRLTIARFRVKLREEDGWRIIHNPSHELLRELVRMPQRQGEDTAHAALDVCTKEEAMFIEKQEREAKRKKKAIRSDVANAGVLRAADLPSRRDDREALRREGAEALAKSRSDAQAERDDRTAKAKTEREAREAVERAALEEEKRRLLEELDAEDEAAVDESEDESEVEATA